MRMGDVLGALSQPRYSVPGLLDNMSPVTQQPTLIPGFSQSVFGQQRNLRLEKWHQQVPPTDLGRAIPLNPQFIERNNDLMPIPENINFDGSGIPTKYKPLWAEPQLRNKARQLHYEWDFQSPHGPVEDVLLMRNGISIAPRPTFNVDPIKQPGYKPSRFNNKPMYNY